MIIRVPVKSSPNKILAKKGSTVRLTWAYIYYGNGRSGTLHLNYIQQLLGFNSTSHRYLQVLARRIGTDGILTVASPLPAAFKGRVQVIAKNSTLVIRDFRASDALYEYFSIVQVDLKHGMGGGLIRNYTLSPKVKIILTGMKY